jgi:Fe-Mn family superoxide dismutase
LSTREIDQVTDLPTKTMLKSLRNNGGGYLNHNEYWQSMASPQAGGGVMDDLNPLQQAIINQFNSMEDFQNEFIKQGMSVFGSGWVFLMLNLEKRVSLLVCKAKLAMS